MSIITAIYNLLIGPLELLFEIIFSLANRLFNHPGLSIIFLSLAVNFLVLPLYKQADAMQEQARETEAKLHDWVAHIKKYFKGDERFMILQAYYRQNNYKPTDALRGSMSLLLEIPFFMAAYNFLSKLLLLKGVSFGPIQDLGSPDSMLVIAGITIHVLPILMTLINLISGAIYTKGFPIKDKIQLYGMALIFLVLLYDSPSGLVFYWTLNNLFSLAKNIFYKLKNPKRVFGILSSVCSVLLMIVVLFIHPMQTPRRQAAALILLLAMHLPLMLQFFAKRKKAQKTIVIEKKDKVLFFSGCAFAALLTGVLIPSAVIKASPAEFINTVTFYNPLLYILNSFLLAAGIFGVWFGIFYMLAKPAGKKAMSLGIWIFSGVAVVNYMFFGTDYGTLSNNLMYDITPGFLMKDQLINLAVIVVVALALHLIWKKKEDIVKFAYLAMILAVVGMSGVNIFGIQAIAPETMAAVKEDAQNIASIPLSKNGKNVVVLMMDRAINSYIPYLFQERPQLQEQFAGFTYYPNTISYGAFTNFGTPPLYGGYEYTPEEMNKREDELLKDKHDEALKVMPVLFNNHGYETTVCDPTYAGYKWIPDLSIYDEYPEIHAYNTMGKFNVASYNVALQKDHMLNRNLFCYGIFKVAPVCLQSTLYNQGNYNNPNSMAEIAPERSAYQEAFMRAYGVLTNLPNITNVTEESKNTFVMLSNDTTHEPIILKEPEYEPEVVVDNTEYDAANKDRFVLDGRRMRMETENQMAHYHANMAAMIQLGQWLDYLRANDVYDNTRIIIVADHGRNLRQFDDLCFGEESQCDVMFYNPLLMVKDFDSQTFTTDNTFMTNGDVPTLATKGLIENPVNPFTGNPITDDAKNKPEQYILYSGNWDVTENSGTKFLPGEWFSVHDNIFDISNWKRVKQ